MEPRESRASTSRSRLAGGGEKPFTASLPACARRSSRDRSNVVPASQATVRSGKTTKKTRESLQVVEMWGNRDPKESMDTYCSRMTARFSEYERCGKELRAAREDLRLARNMADRGSKKKRPELRVKIQARKAEVEALEKRRKDILEGSGLFREKLVNEDRFAVMKSPGKVVVDDGESSGGEEEEMEEANREAEVRVEDMVMDDGAASSSVTPNTPLSEDHLAAAQMAALPSSDGSEDSDGGLMEGGVLRAIILQESPTHFENFSFGDDLGPEGGKRRKKKRKGEVAEKLVFSSLQQPGPAEKSVQAAGPPGLQDPASEVERGQQGGYIVRSKMAEGDEKPVCPAGREGQDRLMVGSSGAAGLPQGGGGHVQAPEEGHASLSLGGGPPGVAGAAGRSPVRGGSVRASAVQPVRSGSAGVVGTSPVREGSPCMSEGAGAGGGTELRPEGQAPPPKVTSGTEAEPVTSSPAAQSKQKVWLKPAVLIHIPASSAQSESKESIIKLNKICVNDGSGSGVDERRSSSRVNERMNDESGSSVNERSGSGVNERSSSGVDERSNSGVDERSSSGVDERTGMDGRSVCNKSAGGSGGSGSGPAAPPVARSYASVAAGGSGGLAGSLPLESGNGHLQRRLLEALRGGERTLQVEGKEVDLSFWVERHGLGAFREKDGEIVWSLHTPGQEAGRRNVARLVWTGNDACPQRGKVVELLLQMGFRARDIFALIHPLGSSEFDVSFVRPEGLDLFWSNYELMKNEPGWRDFAVKAISRQNMLKKVTVLTRNESLSCYDIMTWLGRYGEVTDVPRKNFDEHGIWSGAWTFSVRLRRSGNTVTHIPSATFLGRDRIQVFYQGQPKLCHRCGDPNHFSANCTQQICALCCGAGHLAATCGQIRCNLCGDLGHPFSRCPRSFSYAAAAPAGESLSVASAGEGTSHGDGAPKPVREKYKTPSRLRREEKRRLGRVQENAQVAGVALGPSPGTGLVGQQSEVLGEAELDEEIGRIRKEESEIALSSGSSQYETVSEEEEGGQKANGDRKKKRRRKRGKSKEVLPSSSVTAPDSERNIPVSVPLIVLSNRYKALGDTISREQPPGGTEPSTSGVVSSGGKAILDSKGKDPGMDLSQCLKRGKGSSSDSDGGGGKERKKV